MEFIKGHNNKLEKEFSGKHPEYYSDKHFNEAYQEVYGNWLLEWICCAISAFLVVFGFLAKEWGFNVGYYMILSGVIFFIGAGIYDIHIKGKK